MQTQLKLVAEPPGEAPAGKCPACEKVFCIRCRKEHLRDDRFTCPDCGEFLKLSEDWLKYVLRDIMEQAEKAETANQPGTKVDTDTAAEQPEVKVDTDGDVK